MNKLGLINGLEQFCYRGCQVVDLAGNIGKHHKYQ
jgi:hypothetical protein